METLLRGFSILLSKSQFSCNMGRKKDLSEDKRHEMVQCCAKGIKKLSMQADSCA